MKYFVMSAALIGSLALPLGSFAATSSLDSRMDGFYTKLQYNGEFFNRIGELSSESKELPNVLGLAKDTFAYEGKTPVNYDPKYKPAYLGGSVAVGHSIGNSIRIELEGLYSRTKVQDKDFDYKDAEKRLMLSSESNYAADDRSAYVNNNGFTNFAGMINAYYDVAIEGAPVTPYIGAGVGLTKISFLDSDKFAFAYQAKGGLKYDLNQNASFFAGYRYFGVINDKFSATSMNYHPTETETGEGEDNKSITIPVVPYKIVVKNSFAVHGVEAGLIFKF